MKKPNIVLNNSKIFWNESEIDWKKPKDVALFVSMCTILLGTAVYFCSEAPPTQLSTLALLQIIGACFKHAPDSILTLYGAVSVIVLGFGIYVLPMFVAAKKKHSQSRVLGLVWLLTGWFWLGWLVCMVWACNDPKKLKQQVLNERSTIAERIRSMKKT